MLSTAQPNDVSRLQENFNLIAEPDSGRIGLSDKTSEGGLCIDAMLALASILD
jgi:hypothetical protein